MRARVVLLCLVCALFAGCVDARDGKDTGIGRGPVDETWDGCDPLDAAKCLLPFPSRYFLQEDAGTETGWRVNYGEETLPLNIDGVQMNPRFWNEKDGYSPNSPLLAFFPDVDLDGPGNIHHWSISDFSGDDVTTVLIDASTGQRVPHFVELDGIDPEPSDQLFVLRPVRPLDFDTQYIVGIRGLIDDSGRPVSVSSGFAALRDGTATTDGDVERQRAHFEDAVFPALAREGFERDSLQLAWDFHTTSRDNAIGRALMVRDDAVAWFGEGGPPYEIDDVIEADCSEDGTRIARTIWGTFRAPLYTEVDDAPTVLNRDAEGLPYANGESTATFIVRVPCSVATGGAPARLVQYGHGFFGNIREVETGWLAEWADDSSYVLVATNWKGMMDADRGAIALLIVQDPSDFAALPERSVQGHIEQIGVLRLAMGDLSRDPALSFDDGDGASFGAIDTSKEPVYYGISQGSIYGAAYFGLSPDLSRAVFSVGGNPYSIMFARSNNFSPFFTMFEQKFDDHRDITLITSALLQQLWDLSEGGGYWMDFNQSPPAGYPEKHMLSQVGIGDAQVTTLAAHMQARNFGARLISPAARPVYGLEEVASPYTGSALVEWSFSDSSEPRIAEPADPDADPHECVRRLPEAQSQVVHFIETGEVIQTCEGVCSGTVQPCESD
ncbi:MAG: hypothetical protein VX265_04050 [Myxococcota bacterium]|nr:hypothetical protein [Myxococcota bacterium]